MGGILHNKITEQCGRERSESAELWHEAAVAVTQAAKTERKLRFKEVKVLAWQQSGARKGEVALTGGHQNGARMGGTEGSKLQDVGTGACHGVRAACSMRWEGEGGSRVSMDGSL